MPNSKLHKYHVVLADKTERDISAGDANVHDGALMLLDNNKGPVVIYAAGSWLACELERKDDRG
jgi:hypothetical protein